MAAGEIHVGDTGTVLTVVFYDGQSVVDISSADVLTVLLEPPSGVGKSLDAAFTTDGTDGSCYAASVAGTFDEDGEWVLQGYEQVGTDPITACWHSDKHRFHVYPNIEVAEVAEE